MNRESLIKSRSIILKSNPKRVITRYYNFEDPISVKRIVLNVLSLSENELADIFTELIQSFESRHKNYEEIMLTAFEKIKSFIPEWRNLSQEHKLILGSYFTMEYSIEAAALFNPSMVIHPDQQGLKAGQLRVIMSLRGTGEGHISCIEFAEGVIDKNGNFKFEPISKFATLPKLLNKHISNNSYSIGFNSDIPISERVIFPLAEDEHNGMEDVRLVRFKDDDNIKYYGTFTAYDGHKIRSKLMQTADFLNFNIYALNGPGIKDKGMALFPQKINGKYAMISRQDSENLRLMYSENLFKWDESIVIQTPEKPWQFTKLGNCGSPIKTEKGWLLLVHGVGPMRKYSIGAYLLDLNYPSEIIARLSEPILSPTEAEREGYVPNVVYSCGGIIHNDNFIIPYAMSDSATGIAVVDLNKLLNIMN